MNFTVALEHGKSFLECLEAAMEQNIPEEQSLLQYQTKVLRTTKEGKHVGVIAVRKDILKAWHEACQKAGLKLKSVTSHPLALASKESVVVVTADSMFRPTLTLFANGWPLDEAVLAEKASNIAIAEELKEFMEEYRSEYPVRSIRVTGGTDLIKNIQDAFSTEAKSQDAQQSSTAVSVTGLFTWVKQKEMLMLSAIAASIAGSGGFNLLRTQKQRTTTAVLILILVLVVCAGVVAYFRPDLIP